MPPEIIALLTGDGGFIVALILALGWMTRQWYTAREEAKSEREKRNSDALLAAQAMTEQKILNQDSKHQIDMRDYRLEDTQKDLLECRQELSLCRSQVGSKQ